MALNPAQGETVGWPRFVQTVSNAWHRIPIDERRHTAIFTGNYGEAGAIDLLGSALRLPRAYSGHNGFSEWGEPPTADTHVLVVGFNNAADAAPYFDQCRTLAIVNDHVGLNNNEQDLPTPVACLVLLQKARAEDAATQVLRRHVRLPPSGHDRIARGRGPHRGRRDAPSRLDSGCLRDRW